MLVEFKNYEKKPPYGRKSLTFGLSDIEKMTMFENNETHIGTVSVVKDHPNTIRFTVDEVIRSAKVGTVRALDKKRPDDFELMKMALVNDYELNEADFIVVR